MGKILIISVLVWFIFGCVNNSTSISPEHLSFADNVYIQRNSYCSSNSDTVVFKDDTSILYFIDDQILKVGKIDSEEISNLEDVKEKFDVQETYAWEINEANILILKSIEKESLDYCTYNLGFNDDGFIFFNMLDCLFEDKWPKGMYANHTDFYCGKYIEKRDGVKPAID